MIPKHHSVRIHAGCSCVRVLTTAETGNYIVCYPEKHNAWQIEQFEKPCEVAQYLRKLKNVLVSFDFPGFEMYIVSGHLYRFARLSAMQVNDLERAVLQSLAH